MRNYELMVVISPDLDDEGSSAIIEHVKLLVTQKGGSVTSEDRWGQRRLAYPIDKFTEGNYVLTHLQLDPTSVKELDANLQASEGIIRHLLVVLSETK